MKPPTPWSIHDAPGMGFFLRDANGQSLGWFKLEDKAQEAALRKVVEAFLPVANLPAEERILEDILVLRSTLTHTDNKRLKARIEEVLS